MRICISSGLFDAISDSVNDQTISFRFCMFQVDWSPAIGPCRLPAEAVSDLKETSNRFTAPRFGLRRAGDLDVCIRARLIADGKLLRPGRAGGVKW